MYLADVDQDCAQDKNGLKQHANDCSEDIE
jgi:hypothetical protein